MSTTLAWRAGAASDRGLQRAVNEDRVLVDEGRGIFLVVDGLGGHAAGELAAETAVRIIRESMGTVDPQNASGEIEEKVRQSITQANNRIYELAQSNETWKGMACVLTLAVAHEDQITVGHVGDSRLYLAWNGSLRKLTSDHSPVGEREDQGELTEEEAMLHPRRNEVFRDVGSRLQQAHDSQFVDVKSFLFRPDAAVLLCSDGLSDGLTSSQISGIIEHYDGDPDSIARQLVEAANNAGGKDNISVVFVAGPEFLGSQSNTLVEVRPRHAVTRMRQEGSRWRDAVKGVLWLLTGMVLGILLWGALERITPRPAPKPVKIASVERAPEHIAVNAADALGIVNALSVARAGDTVEVPSGQYVGPLQLKDHVNVIAGAAGEVTLRSDPASATDPGVAMIARGIQDVRVRGMRIVGDEAHPLRTGIWVTNSSVEIDDMDVSGAIEAGIRVDGDSRGLLLANFIHANPGTGVMIKDQSALRLAGNWISENGRVPRALRAGIEIESSAKPILEKNVIVQNGLAALAGK